MQNCPRLTSEKMLQFYLATCPERGHATVFVYFISLIVAPVIVGIIVGTVNTLFSSWLEKKDKDDDH